MGTRRPLTPSESRLVSENLGLVPHLVNKLRGVANGGLENEFFERHEDELIQEGNEALCRAAQSFDSDRGFAYSTYAGRAIHNALWRFVTSSFSGLVVVPYYKSVRGDSPSHQYTGMDELEENVGQDETGVMEDISYSVAMSRWKMLNRPYSDILTAIYHEDATFVSIADVMGTTAVKVKRMHDEALRYIRTEME